MVSSMLRRLMRARTAYLFLLPVLATLLILNVYPVVTTIWLSFHELNLLRSPEPSWVGLGNFVHLLTRDGNFWLVMGNTLIWVIGSTVLQFVLAFGIAALLNRRFLGRKLVRTLILIPWVTPIIVVGIAWRWILNPEWGMLNHYFLRWGIIQDPVTWLYNPNTVWPVLLLASVWKGSPFMAIMLLAGLQTVPRSLYEAAIVDGANSVQLFRHITIPMMAPIIVIVTLITTMETWNNFRMIWVLTEGGPGYRTTVVSVYIYFRSFQDFQLGMGAALAVVSVLTISILGVLYIRMRARMSPL